MIFPADKILGILTEAVAAGLHDKRNQLLFGIDAVFVSSLSTASTPRDQLWLDLARLNDSDVVGGIVPLERWLRNAAYAMMARPEANKFFTGLAEEAAHAPRPSNWAKVVPKILGGPAAPAAPAGQPMTFAGVGSAALDPAIKEALVQVVATNYTFDDLDLALQKCFSDARIRNTGLDKQQPLAEVVSQCLDLVERERLTVVFLRFVLASPRTTAEAKTKACAMFPELQTVNQPFLAIVQSAAMALVNNTAAIVARAGGRAPLQRLADLVDELKCYKGLHEAIHQLRLSPAPQVPGDGDAAAGRKFRHELRNYLTLLSTARTRVTSALGGLPAGSSVGAAEQSWITQFDACLAETNLAVTSADLGVADRALEISSRTFDPLLNQLNARIVDVAMRLLEGLVEALVDSQAGEQLAGAVSALRLGLLTRVVEHSRWQEADDALFALERTFRFASNDAFTRFARQWPRVRRQIEVLADGQSTDPLRGQLKKMTSAIDSALAEVEKSLAGNQDAFNTAMFDPYDALRSGAQDQFFSVDSELKGNCAELTRIQAPLATIIAGFGP